MIKEKIQISNDRLALINALKQLLADLNNLGPIPNNVVKKECYIAYTGQTSELHIPTDFSLYDYAIKFFNIIAKFQDSNILKPNLLADKTSFNELSAHITNSGRCYCGWVRAKPGETVTEENVFLGDVFGLYTLPIKRFKECVNDPKTADRDWINWAVQIYQLQNFLKSHVEPTKALITTILFNEERAKRGIMDRFFDKMAARKK